MTNVRTNVSPSDEDFLTSHTKSILRSYYREYYTVKERNFCATARNFGSTWELFSSLDDIWMREIDNIGKVRDPNQGLPILLFLNAHNKFRVAWELVFSCRVGEAWDTIRSAIESVAHADKILREPPMANVWLCRDDGEKERKAFKAGFLEKKRSNLFPSGRGFDELYKYYGLYSDWGTHTNLASIAPRVTAAHTQTEYNWQYQYFETNPRRMATFLYSVLIVSRELEKVFYNAFQSRLQFDVQLAAMRESFQRRTKVLANEIIARYKVERPAIFP